MKTTNPLLPVASQPYIETIQKGQPKPVQKGIIEPHVDSTIKSEECQKTSRLDTFKKWFQKSSCCCGC